MRTKLAIRAAAVTFVAAFALAGCSSGGGSSQNNAGQVDRTLQLAISAPPSNFSIGNWSGGDATLFNSVYEDVLGLSVDGKVEPGIAESWEYNSDRTQLTLHIRKGMKFTDDTPVDAQAVVASLEVARKGASTSQNLSTVTSVKATDGSTVVVALSQPDAALLPSLASTVGAVGATKVLTAESSKLEPVGSGPYVLDKSQTTVGSTYTLVRNDGNWNAKAYPFKKVVVKVIPDATAAQNALRSGQLDVLPAAGTKETVAQFPQGQFTTGENKATAFGALWIVDREGKLVPALKDSRVREAINLVFDRDSIAKNLTGPGSAPTNQVFSPSGQAFSTDLLSKTPYDLDKARKLMAEAGYADGFTVTMPSTPVSTTFESTLTQSLSDIGIKVKWETVPFQDFYPKVFGGNYGMFFMYNGYSGSDAQDVKASLSGIFNPSKNTTPELQKLLAAANSASEADQGAAFRAVNNYLVEQSWNAPLNSTSGYYVASNKVKYTPPVSYGQNVKPYAPADSK